MNELRKESTFKFATRVSWAPTCVKGGFKTCVLEEEGYF